MISSIKISNIGKNLHLLFKFSLFCIVLSILIPVYNQDVYSLVKSVHDQLMSLNHNFEILCLDDSSTQTYLNNSKIDILDHCKYVLLESNVGRSAIRNMLAKMANYEYLLFIDSDMLVIDDAFIQKYLLVCQNYDVVYGGIKYHNNCLDHNRLLRWKYGTERESLSVEKRNLKPYVSAKFCNLLIRKKVFSDIQFDEQIKLYGHEDTLFSLEMQSHKLKILHIENPLLHDGLEDSSIYLKKVEIASINLKMIDELHPNYALEKSIPLLSTYKLMKKYNFIFIYKIIYQLFKNGIERNLLSVKPNIRLLDFYKLYSICKD